MSFKKQISLSIILILICTVLNGCGTSTSNIDYPKDGIVIVHKYENWAYGCKYEGHFIDINGDMYQYDFSDEASSKTFSDEQFMEKLMDVYESTEPTKSIRKSVMKKCYANSLEIDSDSETIEEYTGNADMGQDSIYVMDNNNDTLIELYSYGDYELELDDDNARKIVKLIKDYVID